MNNVRVSCVGLILTVFSPYTLSLRPDFYIVVSRISSYEALDNIHHSQATCQSIHSTIKGERISDEGSLSPLKVKAPFIVCVCYYEYSLHRAVLSICL